MAGCTPRNGSAARPPDLDRVIRRGRSKKQRRSTDEKEGEVQRLAVHRRILLESIQSRYNAKIHLCGRDLSSGEDRLEGVRQGRHVHVRLVSAELGVRVHFHEPPAMPTGRSHRSIPMITIGAVRGPAGRRAVRSASYREAGVPEWSMIYAVLRLMMASDVQYLGNHVEDRQEQQMRRPKRMVPSKSDHIHDHEVGSAQCVVSQKRVLVRESPRCHRLESACRS